MRPRRFKLGVLDDERIKIYNIILRDLKEKFPEIKAKKVLLLQKNDPYFKDCEGYYEPDSRLMYIATRNTKGKWYTKFEGLDTLCHECAHSALVDAFTHDVEFWSIHYKYANYCFNTIYKRRKDLWKY